MAEVWVVEATELVFPLWVLQHMQFCTHNSEETTLTESYCKPLPPEEHANSKTSLKMSGREPIIKAFSPYCSSTLHEMNPVNTKQIGKTLHNFQNS